MGIGASHATHTEHHGLRRGFTIVELLIVVVVIAILASITTVTYNGIQMRARDSERVSDISTIQKLLEAYYIDNGTFPLRADLRDPAWRAANLMSRDQGPFINPLDKGSDNSIVASGSTVTIDKYSYYEMPTGTATGYRMTYKLEANPTSGINISVDK